MPKSASKAPATSPGSSAEFGDSATTSTPVVKKEKKKRKLQDKIKMEIETLVHRRGLAKGKVTKILKAIRPTETAEVRQLSEPQVHVYLKKLETAQKEYMSNHESILAMVDMEGRKQADKHYEEFDDLHDKVALMLEEQLLGFNATRANGTLNATAPPQAPHPPVIVHQPLRMPIPSFDGRYESWPKFKVLFKEVVDKAPDPPAVKLYHLEHALVGGAVGSIDAKTISEGNYAHAWEILEEKYGNKRHTIDRHIHGLLNLSKMTNEDHVELRGLVDECTRHVESLKFLGQEFTGVSELIVVHLLGAALDKDTRRLWESEVKNCDLPKYDKMLQFLKAQCFVLERCEDLNQKQPTVQPKPVVKSTQKSYAMSTSELEITSEDRCDICGNGHKNHACPVFKELPMPQKLVKVREHNLCFNCLKRGHPSKKCTSPGTCSKCKLRHHSLLHSEGSPRPERKVISQVPPEQAPEVQPEEAAQLTTASCHNVTPTQQVLLLTAVVDIMDRNNKAHPCRVLLDSASQANLISRSMVESLGLNQFPSNVTVAGIDNTKTHASTGSVVQLRSRYSSFSANVKCLVTERVTADLPTSAVNVRNWELPPGVQLADPSFHQPGKVDLLLGNQLFLKLLLPGEVQLSEHLPMLRETQLGWVVGGVCDEEETAAVVHSHMAILENLNLEASESDVKVCNEQRECELHLEEAAKIIEEDLKVDNAVFASDGISQTIKESQLIQLCKTGGFELHNWSSECSELLETIPEANREEPVCVEGTGTKEVIKALGLLWNPTADELLFATLPPVRGGRQTKSKVLSLVSSISDPARLTAPVFISERLVRKLVWKKEIGWIQEIPEEVVKEDFLDAIRDLDKLRVPRRVVTANAAADELHKYAAALKHTYGACRYVKSVIPGSSAELNLKLVPKTVKTTARSELLVPFLYWLVKNVLMSSRELGRIYAFVERCGLTCKKKVKKGRTEQHWMLAAKAASPRLEIRTHTNLDLGDIVRVVDLRTRRDVLKRPILYNAASGGEDVRAESCQPEENFTSEQCPTPRLLRSMTKLATARR